MTANYQKITVKIPSPPVPGIGAYWPFCLWVPRRRERELLLSQALREEGLHITLGYDTLKVLQGSKWVVSTHVDFPRPWETWEGAPPLHHAFDGLYGRQVVSLLSGAAKRGLLLEEQTDRLTTWRAADEKENS